MLNNYFSGLNYLNLIHCLKKKRVILISRQIPFKNEALKFNQYLVEHDKF